MGQEEDTPPGENMETSEDEESSEDDKGKKVVTTVRRVHTKRMTIQETQEEESTINKKHQ